VRALLGEIEEELRTLRREVTQKQIEFFTEKEFAAKLRVSHDVIANMRRDGELDPLRLRGLVRYSSLQLENAHEIFGQRTKKKGRSGRARGSNSAGA
jgi:ribosomal protein S13